MNIHHLICGSMHAPPNPPAICHCLLLETADTLVLIDTGLGLLDVQQPATRLGQQLIDLVGFQFDEEATALRQLETLGRSPSEVRHIVLTHADPDHTGGLADFPHAAVHIAAEEHASLSAGHWRYLPTHFAHHPRWEVHGPGGSDWFGLPSRPLAIPGVDARLVPLFGHTRGHCGVAVAHNHNWLLHVGDAYYLRPELATDDLPVSQLAAARADDDAARRASLQQLRRLHREHAGEIFMFGYHDPDEFPSA